MPLPVLLGLVYLVSEAALRFAKQSRGERKPADAGSLAALWIGIGVAITAAVFAPRFAPNLAFGLTKTTVCLLIGLFAAGLALRWWAILTLGRLFTVDVAIARDHHLVIKGPYRFVRHPSYAGMMIAFTALAATFQNGLSVLLLPGVISIALAYRIRVEEKALRAAFGADYQRYAQTTKRLIPGVF